MVDFVKKKIVEKLAKFTKHLNPNDISLSFLKGKGELNNLDLNADFITDALRLPPWIRIRSVFCDQIKIDVPFTDLNKSPIKCMLHTVIIEVNTCDAQDEERESTAPIDLKKLSSSSSTSSYGLTEKIIDGMKVEIGCVKVKFENPVFTADLEMTDVVIESTTPEWKPDILPHCRYKNNDEGSVIIYKKCTWSSLKIEGSQVTSNGSLIADPIRLLANTTEIRVSVKRRTSDCKVLCTRLSINLGDLSWVLTQEHLKSISLLAQSLTEAAVQWNQDERKKLALLRGSRDSLDSVGSSGSLASTASREDDLKGTSTKRSKSPAKDTKNLKRETSVRNRELSYQLGQINLPSHEVIQDSIHIKAGTVNLQLCDKNGSLLLHVKDLVMDIYLDQQATTGRCHWNKSNIKLSEATELSSTLVKTAEKVQYMDLPSINLYKLKERGVVVRCSDFRIKSENEELLPIVSCDNKTFSLPNDLDNPAFQFVITMYFYPLEEGHRFLVPRPNVYAYLAPIHVNVHQQLFLWLAEFTHGVIRTINLSLLLSASTEGKMVMEELKAKREMVQQLPGIDVKFYTPYTKVTLPSNHEYADDRPRALQVETGGISLQNHSLLSILSNKEFILAWEKCRSGWLSNSSDQFPSNKNDCSPTPKILADLIETELKSQKSATEIHKSMNTNRSNSLAQLAVPPSSLSRSSSGRYSTPDVSHHKISLHQLNLLTIEAWYCHTRCVSLSFVRDLSHSATLYGTEFVSDFPLQLWVFQPKQIAEVLTPAQSPTPGKLPPDDTVTSSLSSFHILLDVAQEVEVKMERLHFLFLMRLKDSFQGFKNKLMQYLTLDSLIEAQNSEAFHVSKDTSSEEVFDETDGNKQQLKEKLSAAFKEGRSKESSVSSKEDGNVSSLATAAINCKGLRVTISLPSLGPVLKSPKPESPVLSSHKSQVSSQSTPLSPLPSKPISTPDLPSASLQSNFKTLSMPHLKESTGDKSTIKSPSSSSSEESDGFVLVMNGNTSSSSLSKSASPVPMELIPEEVTSEPKDTPESLTTDGVQPTITTDGVPPPITTDGVSPSITTDSVPPPITTDKAINSVSVAVDTLTSSVNSSLQVPCINEPSLSSSQVSLLTPKHSLFIKTGQLKVLLTLSDQGIALRTTVDTLHIDELTSEEISEIDRKRTYKDRDKSVEDVASPVIKARVELGKNVTKYFTTEVEDFDIDGVVFLKVSGLKVVLGIKNLMAVKDFFDDEKESNTPIPIQLRIIETQLVIKDQLSFPLVHPKNATVIVPDIFVNRGPRAHGTNLVQSDHHNSAGRDDEGMTDHRQQVVETVVNESPPRVETNNSLLESFHHFIEVFKAQTTENISESKPDKASFLIKELGKTLSLATPPSHNDSLSCDFYSNVTSSSPYPTVDSLRAEVEVLRADNKKLQLEVVAAREQYSDSLKEKDEITRELINAKVNLASAHLVMEQNLIKMERLYSENCNLKDKLGE